MGKSPLNYIKRDNAVLSTGKGNIKYVNFFGIFMVGVIDLFDSILGKPFQYSPVFLHHAGDVYIAKRISIRFRVIKDYNFRSYTA